jgi:hypothetical protein
MKSIYGIRFAKKPSMFGEYNFDTVNWNCHARFFLSKANAERWLEDNARRILNNQHDDTSRGVVPFCHVISFGYINPYLNEHGAVCCGKQLEYEINETGERFIFWIDETTLMDV